MRLAFFALGLSVIVWSFPIGAQTRGTLSSASGSSSAPSRSSVSAGSTRSFSATSSFASSTSSGSNTASTTTPKQRFFFGIPPRRFHDRDFGRDFIGNHHRRSPFGSPFGFPIGYGYGYGVDYSGWYTDQNQLPDQENMAQSERLQQSYQDDQKRQRELERQLADQRAADATEANLRYAPAAPAPTSTSAEREAPPTVLVYKDRHQVEIRSYAVTGSTIYEFNPHWTRKIPLSEIDIPATIAANNERGIEFHVPAGKAK